MTERKNTLYALYKYHRALGFWWPPHRAYREAKRWADAGKTVRDITY